MRVIGGERGFSARLENIRSAGGALESLGGTVGDLVRATPPPPGVSSLLDSPVTWAKVEYACTAFFMRTRGLSDSITKLGTQALLAAAGYETADSAARAAQQIGSWAAGWGLGVAVRVTAPLWAVPAVIAALTAAGWIVAADGLVTLATGNSPEFGKKTMAAARGIFEQALANNTSAFSRVLDSGLSGFATGLFGLPPLPPIIDAMRAGPLTRSLARTGEASGAFPTEPPEVRSHKATPGGSPRSLSGLYEREVAAHSGRDNGRVRVDAVRGPDGKKRYIVYVPATTDWSVKGGRNTTDTATNVQTMAQRESAMRHVVRTAIKESGIGPDDEIMFVGYSQGGIVAASLAADPEFRKQANVRQVVTVGSPIGRFDVGNTKVLSIEQDRDVIPALDGTDNPDKRNWTTIIADSPPVDSPLGAHSSDAYTEVIRDLEKSRQPDVVQFSKDNRDFLGGTVEESREFEGVRKEK